MTTPARRESGALPSTPAQTARIYLRPVGLLSGSAARAAIAAGRARSLAGGPLAFTACEVLLREAGRVRSWTVGHAELLSWAERLPEAHRARTGEIVSRLGASRTGQGARPLLMGIVNATPDSFSEAAFDPAAAVAQGMRLAREGAGILDIGGESTRPGAAPVDTDEELRRVRPVLEGLAGAPGTLLSIDTRKAAVMQAALASGARILNDVSALTGDPDSPTVAAASTARVVLMHMQGTPETMNRAPRYDCAPLDVFDFLEERIAACAAAGIARERLIVDPGIGFGKHGAHNQAILAALSLLHGLGVPILLGVSRKGLSEAHERDWAPAERLPGSLAAALRALDQGVQMLRVHDVAATRQAVDVWCAINAAG